MKFTTSTYIVLPIEATVRADPVLQASYPKRGSDLELPWPSEGFDRLMKIASDANASIRVSCRMHLEPAEESSIKLWVMHLDSYCTSNDRDDRWRRSTWDLLPFLSGTRNVRRFESYRISKLRSNEKKITAPGGVFFYPQKLINVLAEAGAITGARWVDVADHSGRPWPDVQLLVPDHLLGPLVWNDSMEWSVGDDGYEFLIPRAWALAASPEVIRSALDFNLTTEPAAGYNLGATVVSPRVRSLTNGGSFKGVFFTPVLTEGDELYDRFLTLWAELETQVRAQASNRLG